MKQLMENWRKYMSEGEQETIAVGSYVTHVEFPEIPPGQVVAVEAFGSNTLVSVRWSNGTERNHYMSDLQAVEQPDKPLNEAEVKFTGILKAMPVEAMGELQKLSQGLPEEAVLLPEEKWHVTLIHQSILKPFKKELKLMEFPPAPAPVVIPEVEERSDGEKRSWVVWLENQEEMKEYVNQLMEQLGGQPNPEPERRFHISLANLTGKPGDSVR